MLLEPLFLLQSLCFRIKAFPFLEGYGNIFKDVLVNFTFEKLSASRNSKSTNTVPLNIATYLWRSGHILNISAALSHQMTGRHFDIIQPLTLNFTLNKQKPKHTPQNTEKIETATVSFQNESPSLQMRRFPAFTQQMLLFIIIKTGAKLNNLSLYTDTSFNLLVS